MDDPEFAAAAKELGIYKVEDEEQVQKIKTHLFQKDLAIDRRDETFRKAEKQLYKEGVLTQDKTVDTISDRRKKEYKKMQIEATGSKKGWKEMANKDLLAKSTNTQKELQTIYDRQAEIENKKTVKESQKYQKQLQKEANKFMKKQNKKQQEALDKLMNAPKFTAQQAPTAPVMPPVEQPDPMPVAPPTPQPMAIQAAPPPQLTTSQNSMGIVRQGSTARARTRRSSRGTSRLSTSR